MALLWMGLGLASAYNECLLGFELMGLDAFESTDWIGMPVCDETLVAAELTSNACIKDSIYRSCFWSVVDCDSDTSCTCQSCGGLYAASGLDEYMIELTIWDRARCAVFALDGVDFDVTPCVEAIVDTMSMPGVDAEWTPPSVSSLECIALESDYYADHVACSYPGSPRFAVEVFSDISSAVDLTPAPSAGDLTPAPSAGVVPVTTSSPATSSTPSPSALPETVAPAQSVMTPAPEMIIAVPPTAAPEVATPAPTPGATESPLGSDPQITPAPSGNSPGQSPAGSPTREPAVETGAPIDASKEVIASDGDTSSGEDSGMSAETAVGIASVAVAFLGVVAGLWGTSSTVYLNCKCCVSAGTGPVVTVGARDPKEKWLPCRMASDVHAVPPAAAFATGVGSEAIVSSATAGFEHMSWTPIPAGTGMSLRLSVDGRSYVFESCATFTAEGGRRVIVGGIKRASAVDGQVWARVVNIVTVNESCALATQYPSRGHFRILRRCASYTSSLATYAVVETIGTPPYVLVLR